MLELGPAGQSTHPAVPGKGAGGGTVQGQILIIISQDRISRASPSRCLRRRGGEETLKITCPLAWFRGNLTLGKTFYQNLLPPKNVENKC